ncbi:hypothetical protein KM043_010837 [Ampulex compressa]|nr:hypothetical protein KM043_010837 [Ampulex compressa]
MWYKFQRAKNQWRPRRTEEGRSTSNVEVQNRRNNSSLWYLTVKARRIVCDRALGTLVRELGQRSAYDFREIQGSWLKKIISSFGGLMILKKFGDWGKFVRAKSSKVSYVKRGMRSRDQNE